MIGRVVVVNRGDRWYPRAVRYVLLDRITALEPPVRAAGVKCVSLCEDVYADHFPGMPVMPAALVIESLAQLGGALLEACARARGNHRYFAVLTEVGRAKFRRLVQPGDRLDLESTVLHEADLGGRVRAAARIDGALVTETELTFAFNELADDALIAARLRQLDVWLRKGTAGRDTSAAAAGEH